MKTAQDVLNFWRDAGPSKWWKKDDAFDASIRQKFEKTHQAASHGTLDSWIDRPEPALALIIVLDQFTRNLNRNSAAAFPNDAKCLALAKHAINMGHDKQAPQDLLAFFYLPLMHSEVIEDQRLCLSLMQKTGLKPNIKAAEEHLDIIERFGRFPHRNKVLGRTSTAEEIAFLEAGGFSG